MSFPVIPNITPSISLNRTQVVDLLLASIAMEEMGLAHIINVEGEKLQYILGTLHDHCGHPAHHDDLLEMNREARKTLQTVLKNQMLLQFKLEDILETQPKPPRPPHPPHPPCPPPPPPCPPPCPPHPPCPPPSSCCSHKHSSCHGRHESESFCSSSCKSSHCECHKRYEKESFCSSSCRSCTSHKNCHSSCHGSSHSSCHKEQKHFY